MTYGQIGSLVGTWFAKHPKLWVNPLSVESIFRASTGFLRVLPDFLIIGAAKCGTTSLYSFMIKHPDIYPALWKEIFFFDRYYPRGINWYRANFPSKFQKFSKKLVKKNFLTGEATPTYIHHPLAAQRVFETNSKIKLIILLRNPIERAYSHYQMEVSLGYENKSFEVAINLENERLSGEKEKMLMDKNYFSYKRQIFSYLTSGIYVDQLKIWMNQFPKEQFLIIKTEDLANKPQEILNQVFEFLNLAKFDMSKFEKYNLGKYSEMNNHIRKKLVNYFLPHNEKLYKFLDNDFNWN